MATHDMPILGASLLFDSSGEVYPSRIQLQMVLTNPKDQQCIVMEFPVGNDRGFSINFQVPQNYAGTPVLVIRGLLNGTPANVLAFGAQQVAVADTETGDVAYEAEDVASNSSWGSYSNEDMYEETITLTPASAYQVGDTIFLWFFRDDSVDTTTFDFMLTDLIFRFSDT